MNKYCRLFAILVVLANCKICFANNSDGDKKPKISPCIEALKQDSRFFSMVPNIPEENVASTLENYFPKNESQEGALKTIRRFVDFDESSKSIGFFLSGRSGTGKTHLAVATARSAFLKQGKRVLYITPETMFDFQRGALIASKENADDPRVEKMLASLSNKNSNELVSVQEGLSLYDVVIIDDLNFATTGMFLHYLEKFIEAVIWAHSSSGKKLLVTSNSSYSDIKEAIRRSFELNNRLGDLERFEDRLRSLLVERVIEGESQRPRSNWAD